MSNPLPRHHLPLHSPSNIPNPCRRPRLREVRLAIRLLNLEVQFPFETLRFLRLEIQATLFIYPILNQARLSALRWGILSRRERTVERPPNPHHEINNRRAMCPSPPVHEINSTTKLFLFLPTPPPRPLPSPSMSAPRPPTRSIQRDQAPKNRRTNSPHPILRLHNLPRNFNPSNL